MKVEIYIATHKAYNYPKIDGYIPIHVGKALTDLDLGIIGDNTGDHISGLNPNFCELTALYWMWKNSDADILGLVHYRRYLKENIRGGNILNNQYEVLCIDYVEKVFKTKTNTVFLPNKEKLFYQKYKIKFSVSMKKQYELNHYKKDWAEVENIIERKFPEYLPALRKVEQSNKISFYNMFIAHRDWVNSYCEWLFSILFELKERFDISNYNAYQSRIYGFISERLFNVYLQYNKEQYSLNYLETFMVE